MDACGGNKCEMLISRIAHAIEFRVKSNTDNNPVVYITEMVARCKLFVFSDMYKPANV